MRVFGVFESVEPTSTYTTVYYATVSLTLHYTTLHYTTLHYTTLHLGYMLTLYIVYNYRILYMPNPILIAIPNISIHT